MSPIRCGVVVLLVLAAVCLGIAQERDELLVKSDSESEALCQLMNGKTRGWDSVLPINGKRRNE